MFIKIDCAGKEEAQLRYLWELAFVMGYLVGLTAHLIEEINQMILINSVACTIIMFGSFTATSLFSKEIFNLFLGGVIISLSSAVLWHSLISWLVGSEF
jgi:hypothetical protein